MHRLVYRFGRFELDSKSRELRGDGGERIAIAPKSLECLLYLIEHRDRAVGRDELISAVWGRLDVSDHLLGQTLRGARLALGDTGAERTTIATVPRFGYRWLAPLEQAMLDLPVPSRDPPAVTESRHEAQDSPPPKAMPGRAGGPELSASSPRRWPIFIAVAVSILLAAVLSFLWLRSRPETPAAAGRPGDGRDTYLVLPVAISGLDSESAWLRLGGMEYIAARLRDQASLPVLSSRQALAVVGDEPSSATRDGGDVHRIRSITGASYVLMPRAARAAEAWTFELDVYHGNDLRTYSGAGARPLDAAAEANRHFLASLGIAAPVAVDTQPGLTERLQRVDAAFLKGELAAARTLIEEAPAGDRDRPELAIRAARVAFRSGRLDDAASLFETLSADTPENANSIRVRAYNGLGNVAMRRGDYAEGERFQSRAIDLLEKNGPRDMLGTAYMERGVMFGGLGKHEEAMVDFGRARVEMERNGDSLALGILDFNTGLVESYRNRYDAALAAMNRAIEVSLRYGVADVLATSLLGKADVQLTVLDNAAALATTERWLNLLPQLENPGLKRRLASMRIRALIAGARLLDATRELDAYLNALPQARGDPQFDVLRAQIRYRDGDFAAVVRAGEGLLERIRHGEDPTSEVSDRVALRLLVSAAVRVGDAATARRWLEAWAASHTDTGEAAWEDEYSLALARAEVAAPAEAAAAERDFARALALADRHGRSDLVVESGLAQVRRQLSDGGGPARALPLAGRLAGVADRDYRVALATAAIYQANGDGALAAAARAKAVALVGAQAATLGY